MFFYIYNNKGMCSSGSFSKDRSRWITFEQTEKDRLETSKKKPYGATYTGIFIPVTSFQNKIEKQ